MKNLFKCAILILLMQVVWSCGSGDEDTTVECQNGTYRCNDSHVERCSNEQWQFLQSCTSQQICQSGQCVNTSNQPCNRDSDCAPSESCVDNYCKSNNTQGYSLSGQISDWVSGAPIPGITVKLSNTHEHITDTNGYYTLTNIPEGEYTIKFKSQGIDYVEKEVTASIFGQNKVLNTVMLPQERWTVRDYYSCSLSTNECTSFTTDTVACWGESASPPSLEDDLLTISLQVATTRIAGEDAFLCGWTGGFNCPRIKIESQVGGNRILTSTFTEKSNGGSCCTEWECTNSMRIISQKLVREHDRFIVHFVGSTSMSPCMSCGLDEEYCDESTACGQKYAYDVTVDLFWYTKELPQY